ncbi:DUF6227 family protein, partial [Streptomyces sp. NPDC002587]
MSPARPAPRFDRRGRRVHHGPGAALFAAGATAHRHREYAVEQSADHARRVLRRA